MKKNMLRGICTAAVCISLSAFAGNKAQAASTVSDNTVTASTFQDSTMNRNKGNMGNMNKGKMNNGKMNNGNMNSGRMNSDSTGKMGNMKGKSSGGYKNKGMGKSKMDTTQRQ